MEASVLRDFRRWWSAKLVESLPFGPLDVLDVLAVGALEAEILWDELDHGRGADDDAWRLHLIALPERWLLTLLVVRTMVIDPEGAGDELVLVMDFRLSRPE